ncbi:MAG: ferredoxin [Candidatus Diapherotrites archaeon]
MAKYKIEHDRPNCIGCGACAAVCPGNWEMTGDKAKPKKTDLNELGCNMNAAQSCPVNVIHITDTQAKKKLI